jgi:hypothetical protein
MNRILVAVALAAPASSAGAGDAPANRFEPLAFLAGSCWKGAFPDGQSSDEHCFEWVYGGRFLRDRHIVSGQRAPYQGETWYGWDPEKASIVYWYFNSLGGVSTGTAAATEEGIVFPERHASGGKVRELRNLWRRTGPDSYRTVLTEKKGDAWVELWTMEFHRSSRASSRTTTDARAQSG